jgi:hypothetical protein
LRPTLALIWKAKKEPRRSALALAALIYLFIYLFTDIFAYLVHIPKFRIGAVKVLANASTSLLGLLRANIRTFTAPRI